MNVEDHNIGFQGQNAPNHLGPICRLAHHQVPQALQGFLEVLADGRIILNDDDLQLWHRGATCSIDLIPSRAKGLVVSRIMVETG